MAERLPQLLAERGLVQAVDPRELDPERLAKAIDAAAAMPLPANAFNLAGATSTAQILREALQRRRAA